MGRPAIEREAPEILQIAAVGLVGEGSECFGYDDALSRDHDWGPGFCLWLPETHAGQTTPLARRIYAHLPQMFLGFQRMNQSPETANRVGVWEIGAFYRHFLGISSPPETVQEWCGLPEFGLAAATNGEVFQDPADDFSTFRRALLNYYPEDVRRKKLAAACALAAQAGQYNYARCIRRGEQVAAMLALAQFMDSVQNVTFLLNRRYRPYYKWSQRRMRELPILGEPVAAKLDELAENAAERERLIEDISAELIAELRRQGLSGGSSDFLLPHAEEIQAEICDELLRSVPLMAE